VTAIMGSVMLFAWRCCFLVCRLKEALRAIAERESDLKHLLHEQKLAMKAYQSENE
jgi:hypothetical protein